jgi:pyridoxamine 5'-phosphate oxidase
MNKDPYIQFWLWFKKRLYAVKDYNAVALSTVDADFCPHSRIVLLKGMDKDQGFIFYTNYLSNKGQQMFLNPAGSLLFYWPELGMQIRVEGTISKISTKQSNDYFQSRSYLSKIGAHASSQSKILKHNIFLLLKVLLFTFKYPKEVPLPHYWGGYCLKPVKFEFWKEGKHRLHTRYIYELQEFKWVIYQIYP